MVERIFKVLLNLLKLGKVELQDVKVNFPRLRPMPLLVQGGALVKLGFQGFCVVGRLAAHFFDSLFMPQLRPSCF